MSTSIDEKFSCEACHRTYTWKPALAGKKVKCKCGQTLRVPAESPAAAEAPPPPPPPADEFPDFDNMDFGDSPTSAPALTPPTVPAARGAVANAPPPPVPARGKIKDSTASESEGFWGKWWAQIGAGVAMGIFGFLEYSRLADFENSDQEKIRVTKLELVTYNIGGKTGVLIGMLVVAIALIAGGLHTFKKSRST